MKTREVFGRRFRGAIASMMTSITAEFQKTNDFGVGCEPNSVFLLPTVTFFPSVIPQSSFPSIIQLLASFFHRSVPFFSHFTPFYTSFSLRFCRRFPFLPGPANLFQKKRLPWRTHNKCSYFSTGQERNNTGKEKWEWGTGRQKKERKCLFKLKADSFVVVRTCLILEV